MENQIEVFKNDKTQNYYKYLKMFAILQRESNKVTREFWTLVRVKWEKVPGKPENSLENFKETR